MSETWSRTWLILRVRIGVAMISPFIIVCRWSPCTAAGSAGPPTGPRYSGRTPSASLPSIGDNQLNCSNGRQAEGERRAHSQLALHPDPAAVQLDELPTQSQPQPRALHLLVRRPHLPELLEHRLLILWGDANAGVADGDLDEPVLWRGRDLDPPTLRGELDRIGQ